MLEKLNVIKDSVNILDIKQCSKKGYQLTIEKDGNQLLEYVDGYVYIRAEEHGDRLIDANNKNGITDEVLSLFGFGTSESSDINILGDALENCLNWECDDLKEEVIAHVLQNTKFSRFEIGYLFDKFMQINVKERVMMNVEDWIKHQIN